MSLPPLYVRDIAGNPLGSEEPVLRWKERVVKQARTCRPTLVQRYIGPQGVYREALDALKRGDSGLRAVARDVESEFRRRAPFGGLVAEMEQEAGGG